MVPSITGGGGGLEFKKLNASDISGVMSNPATADLNMNNWGISNVPNISNTGGAMQLSSNGNLFLTSGGGAMQLSSNGNLFLTSANEVQIQPSFSANIVLECASTGGAGDIILRWPDAGLAHNIQIGNNNTTGGNRSVLIMANNFTSGTNSLIMGSSNLTTATFRAANLSIGGITAPSITTITGGTSLNAGIKIGTAITQRIGFFGVTPIAQPGGVGANITDIHKALKDLGLIAP
jgi:hypothetical protein